MTSPTAPTPRLQEANSLPVGTRLGEFELLSLLGVGGFGIVYLAFDHALEREVAVKEYMPVSLAGRTETMHVSLRSQSDAETFALGLRSFVNEARLLARFDHPSLLKVLRFWEANGTAYMAMPVMRGRTLKELRTELGRAPDESILRSMLDALLGALERLHGEGVYHRDIAPDNIQIEPDGHPVLLDFGAARRVLSDKTQSLTAILKPAYAPIEQYAETGSVKQGPWTDFYALGATLHFVLLGKPPAPATARAVFDESSALAGQGLPGYSLAFLQMVDWMLAPRPNDRPQNVAELRQVLRGERQVPSAYLIEPSGDAWDKTQVLPHGLTAGDDPTLVMPRTAAPTVEPRLVVPAIAASVSLTPTPSPAVSEPAVSEPVVSVAGAADAVLTPSTPSPPTPANLSPSAPAAASAAVSVAAAARRRSVWPAAAAATLAVVVVGFIFWPKATPTPAPALVAEPTSLPQAGATGTPAVAAAAAVPPIASPVSTPAAIAAATTATAGAAQTPPATASVQAPPARAVPESEVKPVQTNTSRPAQRAGANPNLVSNKAAAGGVSGAAQSPTAAEAAAVVPAAAPTAAPGTTSSTGSTSLSAAMPADTAAARQQPGADGDFPAPGAAGPEAKCAGRNALSHFVCMERECLRSSFSGHADCQAWRKSAKRE